MQRSLQKGGFTLLEMVITMVIFILLATVVFTVLSGVLQGASTLQDNQNHGDQVTALNAFVYKKLRELPAQDGLISYRHDSDGGEARVGIVYGGNEGMTAIDAKIQPNGLYTLRLGRAPNPSAAYSIAGKTGTAQVHAPVIVNLVAPISLQGIEDSDYTWTPLIHDVQHIDWKFQELNAPQWIDDWNNASVKPNLVQFSIQIAGDLHPALLDIWIPKIDPVPVPTAQAAPAGTSTTNAPPNNPATPPAKNGI